MRLLSSGNTRETEKNRTDTVLAGVGCEPRLCHLTASANQAVGGANILFGIPLTVMNGELNEINFCKSFV